jgi:hypothetical protein
MRVLVLGGYGNFGARICRALASSPEIELFVGGRDATRCEAFAKSLGTACAAPMDHQAPALSQRLRQMGAGLVIHTAGPFQQQAYVVALAAAEAGAHYIDLADGRRFVCDFPAAVDAAFRAKERTAITGASTVPALSSAVVQALSQDWQRLDSIDICIAPAQTAPRGVATLQAVLSYCGEPVKVWRQGRWTSQPGWAAPQPVRFARLRERRAAVCDIPDLELFPAHFAGVQSVEFRAALEVGLAQTGLAVLAALRGARLIPSPAGLAGLLNAAAPLLDRFGSALGGMYVRVKGVDCNGQPVQRAWHIAADDDHGPEIPCMAAILLARRLAAGEALPVGARPCLGDVALAEFEPEFQRWGMRTDVTEEAVDDGAWQA